MNNGARIDWDALAKQLEIDVRGQSFHYTHRHGERALELIIGENEIKAAVDYFLRLGPAFFLPEMVLQRMRSWIAMEYCHEAYLNDSNQERRHRAVGLIASIGDERVLPWVEVYLSDPDPGVQWNGLVVLDFLLFRDHIEPDQAVGLLNLAEQNPDHRFSERVAEIRRNFH